MTLSMTGVSSISWSVCFRPLEVTFPNVTPFSQKFYLSLPSIELVLQVKGEWYEGWDQLFFILENEVIAALVIHGENANVAVKKIGMMSSKELRYYLIYSKTI